MHEHAPRGGLERDGRAAVGLEQLGRARAWASASIVSTSELPCRREPAHPVERCRSTTVPRSEFEPVR